MNNFWNNLNERERRMLLIGGTCLLLYLLYALLLSPMHVAVSQASQGLKEKKATLAWMQEMRQKPLNTGVQVKVDSGKLLTILGNQLNEKPFLKFPHQLQQTSQGDVELSFETVPYNPLLVWLWSLENKYAITLKQFDANRLDTAGLVKLRMIIQAS